MQNFLCKHLYVPLSISPKGKEGTAGKPKHCSVINGIATRLKNVVPQQAVRIMKLTATILLAACLQVSAKGYSQKITLSVKDAPLEQVFTIIEKQSDYSFNYYHEHIKQAHLVSIQVKDASLEEVLAVCFKEQPFTYEVINRLIIIKENKQTITGLQQKAIPPDPIEVHGIITDENGAPAQGVNVMVKGTSKGTTTNLKGEFVLTNVDENAVLLITSVGYDRQVILVKNKKFITTQLRVAVGNLDELQVIAYGTTKKRFSTGNISSVKAIDIEKQPVNNPLLALQGRVPGLVITQNTGIAGGGITVRIQGQNSMIKGNDPLYVIDGVPITSQIPSTGLGEQILGNSGPNNNGYAVGGVGNPLAFLNPADIESIEVLKDADATSIYGSRAANGAILITTKKGKAGSIKVEINAQMGWGDVAREMKMLNTREYLDMRYEALINDGRNINTLPPTSSSYYDLKIWDTTRYTNWQKVLIGGIAQYNNISSSISGGTENIQYIVGGTYHRETTVFPGEFSDQRASAHFNINGKSANNKFRMQFTGNYLIDNNQLPQTDLTNNAIVFEPVTPALYKSDGTINWQPTSTGVSTFNFNPAAALLKTYRNKTNNLISNAILGYKILPSLELTASFGYNKMQGNEFLAFPLSTVRPESRPTAVRKAQYGFKDIQSWIIEPQINYERQISKGKLTILVGATVQHYTDNGFFIEGQGYSNDNVLENINAATAVFPRTQFYSEYKYNAGFGRINYNWQDKYILNLNARRDGSSRFGPQNRFHNFSSIGAAWIFSQEPLIQKHLPFLSFGKIRASYGTTGNDGIGDYSFLNLYSNIGANVPYQGSAGLQPDGLFNARLQWEETRKFSVGINIGVLKDRVFVDLNYSRNRSSNQLLSYSLPLITGFSSVAGNFPATVQNSSLEFSLNSKNITGRNFAWNTSFNFTIPKNKLVAFPDIENSTYSSDFFVGQSLSAKKVFHLLGVDPQTGKYMVDDIHGNPTTSPSFTNDRNTFINLTPKLYGGLQNNFTFKRFQIDFLFQFVKQIAYNYKFYNGIVNPGQFSRGQSNQPVSVLNRWQTPGDVATIQKYSTSLDAYVGYVSDAAYSDGSYLRLKNLSLVYSLPLQVMQKVHLQSCSFYVQGQNLLTITNYKGLDPENRSLSALPPLRVWVLGIKLGL